MGAKDTARCPIASGCRRSRCVAARYAALKRSSPSCSGNSPRPARTPRPPPSRPPPTSSSRPSRRRPPARTRRQPGGQPGHPKHERAPFPPEMLAAGPTDYLLDACPGCGGAPARDRRRPRRSVVQQVDIAAVPLAIQEHRSHPGWCPHCRKMLQAPLPLGDRARRPGRAAADHPDRLPQGGLPRLLLDHPQVPPRRGRRDHLARAAGQDHRQGQPGPGAALPGVARRPARPGACSTWTRPGTSRTASGMWTWCFRAGLYTLFKIDPTRSGDVLIEVLGDGVRRGAGLRLLLGLSPLHARVRRGAPVLPGASDPRREVPDDAARRAGPGLRERLARGVAGAVRGDPPARASCPEREFQRRLEAARDEVLRCGTHGRAGDAGRPATWRSGWRRTGRATSGS